MADAANPAKKKKERVSPIPGLDLVKPADLHVDFKKFRHDDLFFIAHCTFYPPKEKPTQRVVALTPQAFFICDVNGKMDRATRVEQLSDVIIQTIQWTKFLSTVMTHHFIVKIPSEFDIYFSIEADKKNPEATLVLAEILEKVVTFRSGKPSFTRKILPANEKIADYYVTERPAGFLSPQEILKQNQQRQEIVDKTEAANKETMALMAERDILRTEVQERGAALRALEAAMGVDLADLHRKKDELTHTHVALHRDHTSLSIEVARIEAEANQMKEKLKEEQSKFQELVEEGIEAAGSNNTAKENEVLQLRKKSHQRELTAAQTKLEAMKAKAKIIPQYNCAEALAARAEKIETEIANALAKLEREFTNADKMTKFYETMNAELERIGNTVAEKNVEKQRLLEERAEHRRQKEAQMKAEAEKKAAAAAPPKVVDDLGLDDDLLGGGPSGSPAPKPAGGGGGDDLDLDDDLLGDGPSKPAPAPDAPPATKAPVDDLGLDDDLLGDGPGKPAAPAAAEPKEDDGLL